MNSRKTRWLLITGAFIVLLGIVAWFFKSYAIPPTLNINASFTIESGDTLSLQKYKGQYVLLAYFQTWCGDCIKELPSIDDLQNRIGKEKLKVIMVSDESWPKINRFKEKYCNTLDYYQSPQTLNSLNVRVFPTTYLLGKEGELLMSKIGGFNWNSEEVIKQLK